MARPTVFVGCGGSGLKTLARVNELFSQDMGWRPRISREIFYVVADTDVEELDGFEAAIKHQMGEAEPPRITRIQLVQDQVRLEPDVVTYFERPFRGRQTPEKKRAFERLRQHWWYHPELEEWFRAPRVHDLTKGAGQCPPISFFLAWKHLEDIGEALRDTFLEAERRSPGQVPGVILVSGMAGGTGRGCWQLLALKIREIFSDQRNQPPMLGVFFDATVFPEVYKDDRVTEHQMKMNSLTGFSELVCWMRNLAVGRSQRARYTLPSMRNPGRVDVLDVNVELNSNANAPVDSAHLVFGEGAGGLLRESKQYFEMAGNFLYALLTCSQIDRAGVNRQRPYHGIGSVLFDVDVVGLRSFYEGMTRQRVLDKLLEPQDEAVKQRLEPFEQVLDVGLRRQSDHRDLSADSEGRLIQRICAALLQEYATELENLQGALQRDDKDDVLRIADELEKASPKRVKNAVGRVLDETVRRLAQLVGPHPAGELRRTERSDKNPHEPDMEGVIRRAAEAVLTETQSLGAAKNFLMRLHSVLEGEVQDMPPSGTVKRGASSSGPMAIPQEKRVKAMAVEASDFEFIRWGPRFNGREQQQVLDAARRTILSNHYPYIKDEVERAFRGWLRPVGHWIQNCEALDQEVKNVSTELQKEVRKRVLRRRPSETADSMESQLFANWEEPEAAIPLAGSPSRFVRRTIKPPMRKGQASSLLEEVDVPWGALDILREAAFAEVGNESAAKKRARMDQVRKGLKAVVETETHLRDGFLEEHFAVSPLVDTIRECWEERFNALAGHADRLTRVVGRFRDFFGVEPRRATDGRLVLPDKSEFLQRMAASVVGVCRPNWIVRAVGEPGEKPAEEPPNHVFLVLPWDEGSVAGDEHIKEAVLKVLRDSEMRERDVKITTVFATPSAESGLFADKGANPFVMLTCFRQGTKAIDDLSSLDYWDGDTELVDWLADAEGEVPRTIFESERTNGGLGYVEPTFAREPFRTLRWKPWTKVIEKEHDAKEERVLQALAYALLDPPQALAAKLSEVGWSLPLLKVGRNQEVRFLRKALEWDDEEGQARENTLSPWNEGERLEVRVSRAAARLEAHTDGEARVCLREMLGESDVFFNQVAPKFGYVSGSEPYRDLLRVHEERLAEMMRAATEESDKEVFARLVEFVRGLASARTA